MPEWFESWFDSKYYHILYKHRDEREAEAFLSRLVAHLSLPAKSKILDLACGKGRHSFFLNKLGYKVVGADLSANSITQASSFENDSLQFMVHDMRKTLPSEMQFDAVLNLFTSFGYFEDTSENEAVLNAANKALNQNGILVIDYLNAAKVIHSLKCEDKKICDGIQFHISKRVQGKIVEKTIAFSDEGVTHSYTERVQLLDLDDFSNLLEKSGFNLQAVFGDYNLGTFDPANSDRLILIAEKK